MDVIVNKLADIPDSEYWTGRKKRSADEPQKARQSGVSDYVAFAHDAVAGTDSNNIKSLTLKLADLLGGATQIDNYYYYDVSNAINSSCQKKNTFYCREV